MNGAPAQSKPTTRSTPPTTPHYIVARPSGRATGDVQAGVCPSMRWRTRRVCPWLTRRAAVLIQWSRSIRSPDDGPEFPASTTR